MTIPYDQTKYGQLMQAEFVPMILGNRVIMACAPGKASWTP